MNSSLHATRTPVIDANGPAEVREHFRSALSHFGSGVVIVTSIDADGEPVGMTVGSFSSISLEPPLVGFFAAHTSTTLPRVLSTDNFCVNVLTEQQHTLAIAFARSGTDKFAGVQWTPGSGGAPRLADAHTWIDCSLNARTAIGDHELIVGAVDGLTVPTVSDPLVFHRSAFHGLRDAR